MYNDPTRHGAGRADWEIRNLDQNAIPSAVSKLFMKGMNRQLARIPAPYLKENPTTDQEIEQYKEQYKRHVKRLQIP